MAEGLYEAYLEPPAQRVIDELSDAQQEEVWRLIQLIELDPSPDGSVKVVVQLPPVVVTVYTHPNWWIMYHIARPGRIAIDAIRPAWPPPDWAPRTLAG
ncbi:MAG: hypothetical protein A3G20_00885 [Acidobacteria bacterium RIFCSPLOWO2_12_FULL_59_11]|nr:MAG: hypothetical protein A3G20_00885 [Acidobacteria bacterium RIFCSPLOWO2_12_FULL_59_11]